MGVAVTEINKRSICVVGWVEIATFGCSLHGYLGALLPLTLRTTVRPVALCAVPPITALATACNPITDPPGTSKRILLYRTSITASGT